ncbi:hypothetical protein C7I55_15415 [Sphingomonas deserti]|uniref:Uncharacterized protein n=1 Tax=Allosphingosinicella deserti TaxID=2116704 RepID=A0A2P7QPP0_9SPHN|nr:hypothetical protein C7I55_15415 [Sphingomonas deserti]
MIHTLSKTTLCSPACTWAVQNGHSKRDYLALPEVRKWMDDSLKRSGVPGALVAVRESTDGPEFASAQDIIECLQ